MSKEAEERAGMLGETARRRYNQFPKPKGPENLPITDAQKRVGDKWGDDERIKLAKRMRVAMSDGEGSMRPRDLGSLTQTTEMRDAGLLLEITAVSGAYYYKFTAYSWGWINYILQQDMEKP